ncbi:RAxF-45 family protein [Bacillus massilinigeriensis]|nr:RAxF-45 family protein [Bacillus mediterraneensis]
MFHQPVLACGYWNDFLYFCRAKFAVAVVNGIRVPFFNNFIANLKR